MGDAISNGLGMVITVGFASLALKELNKLNKKKKTNKCQKHLYNSKHTN